MRHTESGLCSAERCTWVDSSGARAHSDNAAATSARARGMNKWAQFLELQEIG